MRMCWLGVSFKNSHEKLCFSPQHMISPRAACVLRTCGTASKISYYVICHKETTVNMIIRKFLTGNFRIYIRVHMRLILLSDYFLSLFTILSVSTSFSVRRIFITRSVPSFSFAFISNTVPTSSPSSRSEWKNALAFGWSF